MAIEVRAMSAPWRSGVEFLIKEGRAMGRTVIMDTATDDNAVSSEPTFSLSVEAAQTLMDDLWNTGLRPTEGAGSAGSLAATQRHLEDMRRLVFQKGKEVKS